MRRLGHEPAPRLYGLAAFAAFTALATGCGAAHMVALECEQDDQCGTGRACSANVCISRAVPPAAWAVEILPRADSTAAFTELSSVALPTGAFELAAAAKVTLAGTLATEGAAAPLATAHVVLTVPPGIPGRPDLQFETDLPPSVDATAPRFSLPIPASVVGRMGILQLLPAAPDNLTHAPSTFAIMVTPAVAVTIPALVFTLRGRLLSAFGEPRSGLMARAFQGSDLVSNVVTTVDGAFSLVVPAGRVGPAPAQAITIELAPPTDDVVDPRFTTKPLQLTANTDLGDISLPAFSQPNVFRFVVHGDSDGGPTVAGAIVRAHVLLADDMVGTTDYLCDGLTDLSGRASLSLLPGSTAALRNYDVAVVPASDSPYAVRCIARFPLAAGGTAAAPANLPAIVLARRPVMTGTVLGDDGTPASGVMILATRTGVDGSTPCAATVGAPPATATTDAHGTFSLPLDPGTYRLDYDPPAGARFPRLTETNVVVPAPGPTPSSLPPRAIQLPPGVLVEGTTRDPSGMPLPLAGVRLYEVTCTSPATCTGPTREEPLLRAQVRSDAEGHFRVVVDPANGTAQPPTAP